MRQRRLSSSDGCVVLFNPFCEAPSRWAGRNLRAGSRIFLCRSVSRCNKANASSKGWCRGGNALGALLQKDARRGACLIEKQTPLNVQESCLKSLSRRPLLPGHCFPPPSSPWCLMVPCDAFGVENPLFTMCCVGSAGVLLRPPAVLGPSGH